MTNLPDAVQKGFTRVQTPACIGCKKKSTVDVRTSSYRRWKQGSLIQDVWPNWTDDERELLKTGIHPACWNKMWGKATEEAFDFIVVLLGEPDAT